MRTSPLQCLGLVALIVIAASIIALFVQFNSVREKRDTKKKSHPNVIMYIFDDVGYSDFGSYGSPLIKTDTVDYLAANGLRFTNASNYAYCNPTRSALMTGLYPHQAGAARVIQVDAFTTLFEPRNTSEAQSVDRRGYNGVLRKNNVFTLGEQFLRNGYHTAQIGKWHLGDPVQAGEATLGAASPLELGFEYFYGGQGSQDPTNPALYQSAYLPDNIPRDSDLAEGDVYRGTYTRRLTNQTWRDFYDDLSNFPHIPQTFSRYTTTDDIAYRAAKYIDEYDSSKPFFLYIGLHTPHDPLLARNESVALYAPGDPETNYANNVFYQMGYDEYSRRAADRQCSMGLFNCPIATNPDFVKNYDDWDTSAATERRKRRSAFFAATHAAMVTEGDRGLGAIVDALKRRDMFDDTLIMVLSDNGAEQLSSPDGNEFAQVQGGSSNSARLNTPGRFDAKGWAWANAMNTPWNSGKFSAYRGGSNTPFVVSWPNGIPESRRGTIDTTPLFVSDVMGTFLDLFDQTYPAYKVVDGVSHAIPRPEHRSFLSCLVDERPQPKRYPYGYVASTTTFSASSFLYKDGWKLLLVNGDPFPTNPKEGNPPIDNPRQQRLLFYLPNDPAEQFDLFDSRPDKAAELLADYAEWERRTHADPSLAVGFLDNAGDPLRIGGLSGDRAIPDDMRQGFMASQLWSMADNCSVWFNDALLVRSTLNQNLADSTIPVRLRFCATGVQFRMQLTRGDPVFDPYERVPAASCDYVTEHNLTYAYYFDDLNYLRTEMQPFYNGSIAECARNVIGRQALYTPTIRLAIRFNEYFNQSIARARVLYPTIFGENPNNLDGDFDDALVVQANGLNTNAVNGLWTAADAVRDADNNLFVRPTNPASTAQFLWVADVNFQGPQFICMFVLNANTGQPLFGPFASAFNASNIVVPVDGLVRVESPVIERGLGTAPPAVYQSHMATLAAALAPGAAPYNQTALRAEFLRIEAITQPNFLNTIEGGALQGAQAAVAAYQTVVQTLPTVGFIASTFQP